MLCVEDNPGNLLLVESVLARRPDIRLLTARDGISGIEALQILAKDPLTARIPVIALSANAMPRDIAKGLEAGFFRYLTKPIKVPQFMETLDLALRLSTTTPRPGGSGR